MGHLQTRHLETGTREKRGYGARRRVVPTVKIPSNWKNFLHIDDNKTELFRLFAQEVGSIDDLGKGMDGTDGTQVLSNTTR